MTDLTDKQRQAWEKIGDVLVPGQGDLPSFSTSGVSRNLEEVLSASHPDDIRDLLLLVRFVALLPAPLIRLLMIINGWMRQLPGFAGAPFRMLDMGLRGVVFTLYYSGLDEGGQVHRAIDFHIQCQPRSEDH